MKSAGFLLLLAVFSLSAFAADAPRSGSVQTGKMSTVKLLATARVTQPAPDGLRFLFLVTPAVGVNAEKPTIKETRDFTVAGQSYQQKSLVALGRKYEPSTAFDSAEGFFAKQPGARSLAPENIQGAKILTITMGGAALTTGATGEIVVHLGFGLEAEDFTFSFRVPPDVQIGGARGAAPTPAPPGTK